MKLDLTKPLETLTGREVKLLATNVDGSDYCIAFAWSHDNYGGFMVGMCDESGHPFTRYEHEDCPIPLIRNKIEQKTFWYCLFKNGKVFGPYDRREDIDIPEKELVEIFSKTIV